MNISEVKIGLKGKDLLSIINEFVKVEGLKVSEIDINENIIIKGSFKKIVTVDFTGSVKLKRVDNGIIEGELVDFKLSKIKIISFIRKAALKFALRAIEEKGIKYLDGKVIIDLKYILKDVPYVDFDVTNINVNEDTLYVEANNIEISIEGTLKKDNKEEDVKLLEEAEEEDYEEEIKEVAKVEDIYTKGRRIFENKLPEKIKPFKEYLFIIPDMLALIYRLLKDKRVPIKTKLVISAAIAYISFPTDIIPDNIPFIGNIDDIGVIIFTLNKLIDDVPIVVILENWQGKNDIIITLKTLVEYAVNLTGARNVEKIYRFIEEISTI
ncbi:YkvA family protein [Clostridium isatidis]|uniref:DUF1232 domain-containing protein n=1 Tax=Clostridium isatidis TaxID=182773 RepID=A0A343JE54_9CLOT|nr:YkvA family protein [Clostridium isatidis]ASW43812.1 hypothetical protein BEN51_10045 [Clostridium isatidis]